MSNELSASVIKKNLIFKNMDLGVISRGNNPRDKAFDLDETYTMTPYKVMHFFNKFGRKTLRCGPLKNGPFGSFTEKRIVCLNKFPISSQQIHRTRGAQRPHRTFPTDRPTKKPVSNQT